jgi:hypothetical protein
MNALLLFIGFVLCVSGIVRGSALVRQWSLRSTTTTALFWSSFVGCLSGFVVIAAAVLMVATFDETRDMIPAITQAWSIGMSALRVSSGASLILHLLLFLIPAHGVTIKPNVA